MSNRIRIRRKQLTGGSTPPTTSDLKWGEIAYNEDADILYYGGGNGDLNQDDSSRIVSIGGSGEFMLRDGSNDQRTEFTPSSHEITTHTGNNWKVYYTNGEGNVVELDLGTNGQVLKSNGGSAAPSFENDNDTTYSKATNNTLGLAKIYDTTVQSANANNVTNNSGRTYGVQFDSNDRLVVNVPWNNTDTIYTHPTNGANSTIEAADTLVLSAITVNNLGHVTSVSSKNLTENDIPILSQSKITSLTDDLDDKLDLSGGTMTGFLTLNSEPTNDMHAVTKSYVDALKQGLDVKNSVLVLSANNIAGVFDSGTNSITTENTSLTVDGVNLNPGDRVLLIAQENPEENGIYDVVHDPIEEPIVLVRSSDADTSDKVNPGLFTFVEKGSSYSDTGWVLTTNDNIVLNGSYLTFSQFSAAGQIYDGSGLIKSGNTIHVGEGDGISVLSDSVSVDSTVIRNTGTQTITGEKDFGNNLKIKPTYNPNGVGWFPAFNIDPVSTSQKMVYMTKADLVTALSFETFELGNSFVNTTGNQSISGQKTFFTTTEFNGGMTFEDIIISPAIYLNNDQFNCIQFNTQGVSDPPTVNGTSIVSGTKITYKPATIASYPASVGVSNNTIWHTSPTSAYSYEWYAGANKIGTLYGNSTFNATNISGVNYYINGTRVLSTASELNLLSFSNNKDILIGNGSNFIRQNFVTALSGAIISQSGLSVTNTSDELIINHNESEAQSTTNSETNVIQNLYIDDYGHITGVGNVDLNTLYLQASDLNTQIQFVSGVSSVYADSILKVFHVTGSKAASTYGTSGIKSITLDEYGHISDVTTANFVTSANLCDAINNSNCIIDGGIIGQG